MDTETMTRANKPLMTPARFHLLYSAIERKYRNLNRLLARTPPIGTIIMYGGSTTPSGYLFCDGSAVSRNTYAGLFDAIGTNYGTGDGSTTFNLPDYTSTFPRGNTAGGAGGSNTHSHPLSTNGHAMIAIGSNQVGGVMDTHSFRDTETASGVSTAASSNVRSNAAPLDGNTDSVSSQPQWIGTMMCIKY